MLLEILRNTTIQWCAGIRYDPPHNKDIYFWYTQGITIHILYLVLFYFCYQNDYCQWSLSQLNLTLILILCFFEKIMPDSNKFGQTWIYNMNWYALGAWKINILCVLEILGPYPLSACCGSLWDLVKSRDYHMSLNISLIG